MHVANCYTLCLELDVTYKPTVNENINISRGYEREKNICTTEISINVYILVRTYQKWLLRLKMHCYVDGMINVHGEA